MDRTGAEQRYTIRSPVWGPEHILDALQGYGPRLFQRDAVVEAPGRALPIARGGPPGFGTTYPTLIRSPSPMPQASAAPMISPVRVAVSTAV
jgi:hypothetical protein